MDLHLLAPGGTYETDTDCYYANCQGTGPDWGQTGYTADDPLMVADDIYGTGPEEIQIQEPGPGVYRVVVHDYEGSTDDHLDPNPTTVDVFLGGSSIGSVTRDISGEDTVTDFCAIDLPGGVVVPL